MHTLSPDAYACMAQVLTHPELHGKQSEAAHMENLQCF